MTADPHAVRALRGDAHAGTAVEPGGEPAGVRPARDAGSHAITANASILLAKSANPEEARQSHTRGPDYDLGGF